MNDHAEGMQTTASGGSSHAEGNHCVASGSNAHAEGNYTIAASKNQHAQGSYNIEDASNTYAHIVGNGGKNGSTIRSNAHTLDWNGNAWYSGTVESSGIVLTAPNGTRYKLTVDNSGNLAATAL